MESTKSDALIALLKPEEGGRRQPDPLRKSLVRHLAPPLFEEGGELTVKG